MDLITITVAVVLLGVAGIGLSDSRIRQRLGLVTRANINVALHGAASQIAQLEQVQLDMLKKREDIQTAYTNVMVQRTVAQISLDKARADCAQTSRELAALDAYGDKSNPAYHSTIMRLAIKFNSLERLSQDQEKAVVEAEAAIAHLNEVTDDLDIKIQQMSTDLEAKRQRLASGKAYERTYEILKEADSTGVTASTFYSIGQKIDEDYEKKKALVDMARGGEVGELIRQTEKQTAVTDALAKVRAQNGSASTPKQIAAASDVSLKIEVKEPQKQQ
jgi:phage shock protein A